MYNIIPISSPEQLHQPFLSTSPTPSSTAKNNDSRAFDTATLLCMVSALHSACFAQSTVGPPQTLVCSFSTLTLVQPQYFTLATYEGWLSLISQFPNLTSRIWKTFPDYLLLLTLSLHSHLAYFFSPLIMMTNCLLVSSVEFTSNFIQSSCIYHLLHTHFLFIDWMIEFMNKQSAYVRVWILFEY